MDNLHEHISKYQQEGLSFIPIPFKSKVPTIEWKKYQTEKPTQQEVAGWFNGHDTNLAIICGDVSDGLVILDFDSQEVFERFRIVAQSTLKQDILEFTRVSKTSRGYHVWLKVGEPVSNQKYPSMDIKSNGGYIIAPPSVHPEGATYKLLNNEPINFVTSLAEIGIQTVKPNKIATTDNPGWVSIALQGVEQEHRNGTALRLAGHFKNTQPIDITTAMLIAWNAKNIPPLPEYELINTIKSAYRYPVRENANNANNANNHAQNANNANNANIGNNANNANECEQCEQPEKWQEFTIEQAREFDDQRLKTGNYAKIAFLVKEFIEEHPGEKFDLDMICRTLEVSGAENRRYVSRELSRKIDQGKLEKMGGGAHSIFKIISINKIILNWLTVDTNNILDIKFPKSHVDNSHFSFADAIDISSGDLIVIAGVSNMGKTGFVQNLMFENMDNYCCQLIVNEHNPSKFRRRIERMTWANPVNENGESKFILAECHEDWKYYIEPDMINIIDWISIADGDFYKISPIMEGIQSKLRKGIAVCVIQKNELKDLGTGGQFSEHLASVYLNIDNKRVTVRKAKEYHGFNPNGRMWGFEIGDGVDFSNIREVKSCSECGGNCVKNHTDCANCNSTGYESFNK
jgi:hypothetical protein